MYSPRAFPGAGGTARAEFRIIVQPIGSNADGEIGAGTWWNMQWSRAHLLLNARAAEAAYDQILELAIIRMLDLRACRGCGSERRCGMADCRWTSYLRGRVGCAAW